MVVFLRSVATWAFAFLYWGVALPVCWVAPAWTARLIRAWGRASFGILGIRLIFENDPPFLGTPAPRVIVCNHQSQLDLVWGACICPERPLAIGKREVVYIPLLNLLWWALRFIRIDRGDSAAAISAISGVAEIIRRESRSLIMAPEGTRTPDGSILPFKMGAFHIAMQAGAPIFPVVVRGAFELSPKGRFVTRPGEIRLRFLDPIATSAVVDRGSAGVRELAERARRAMVSAYEEMRSKSLNP